MEKFCFGKIVKLHGIVGQVKIATKLDSDFDLGKIKAFFNENDECFAVNRIFKVTDGVVATLDGVDYETAKSMIGNWLYIDRSLLAGKILYEDLKGSEVLFEDGTLLGKITDVSDYGSAEVITFLRENGTEVMFPNADGVILNFDYKSKKLTLNRERFLEVADYED